MTLDSIIIRDLAISCVIGVHNWERSSRQPLLLGIELTTDCQQAALADDINAALDYTRVCEGAAQIAENGHFQLIETLAERIAEWLLAEFPTTSATVTVHKPEAVRLAASVGVRITRPRADQQ